MQGPPELHLRFADEATLRSEFEKNLRKARVFLPGVGGIAERSRCTLRLEHPGGATLCLRVEVVYAKADDPGKGVGLSLDPFDDDALERLRAFVDGVGTSPPEEPAAIPPQTPEPEEPEDASPAAQSLQDRIRKLSTSEQQKVASQGGLQERLLLERAFGPAVWESLISNPRITPPEIARIAKKGAAPKPLIEAIATNSAWLASPEIQRALLSNPRTGPHLIPRLLRALSRADLALVPAQSAYPPAVRAAAKKMLQG